MTKTMTASKRREIMGQYKANVQRLAERGDEQLAKRNAIEWAMLATAAEIRRAPRYINDRLPMIVRGR